MKDLFAELLNFLNFFSGICSQDLLGLCCSMRALVGFGDCGGGLCVR